MATAQSPEPAPLVLAPRGKANVVLIGAGFAGLAAARQLARQADVYLTIMDRRNYHLFQPLLYQVATAGLDPANIAVPIRAQFERASNVEVHLAEVDAIDLDHRTIRSAMRTLTFDYLIVATGASHSYFGHPAWEAHAPGLKTLEQAVEIRRRVLTAFERAENERDETLRAAYLTFVVVGGGPTGVELAGAIADIRRTVLTRDFRRIDPRSARVLLCQGSPRLLPQFEDSLARKAARELAQLGVEVMTSTRVEHVDGEGVVANDHRIVARTVLWAAGVMSSALGSQLCVQVDRAGRVPVAPDLSLPDHPNVFVVGDLARVELPSGGLAPGLASVAIQEGRTAAHNILASVRGHSRKPFHYHDKGMLATIGKHRAVAQLKHVRLTGYIAWCLWLVVHLFFLAGFHNRLEVFRDWAWSYLFSKRGSRLIMSGEWRLQA
ncbi:MAG TPA: NAD(P)/FAD-dependent oxidoreductase [Kofleriaceae bacterium]|nr:NAD(P)/FAD-dependent oxidoreductase [Kofleriaceae bacterium]